MKTGETVKILRSYKQGKGRVLCHDLRIEFIGRMGTHIGMEYTLTDNELVETRKIEWEVDHA